MRTFDNKELSKRIDEVLFYVWDPIGVSNEPFARAEYKSYVPEVLRLVEGSEKIKPISDYLSKIVTENMGLSSNQKHCDECAELLLRHKRAIKDGYA